MNIRAFLFGLLLFCFAAPAHAQTSAPADIQFFFPLACTLGVDCWTVNYVDIDPLPGAAKDFSCGKKTYDDHKGTDFGLKNFAATNKGVDVLAAAAGKVLRVRDGKSDGAKTTEQLDEVRKAKKECGNAVLIDHGAGMQTLYCHLRGGSIVVKPGMAVTQGQKIAQVGQSGIAQFPHLHFGVVREGNIIDPYTNRVPDSTCGTPEKSLWSLGLPMKYESLSLFAAEFLSSAPDFDLIKKQDAAPEFIPASSSALSFWAGIYGAQKGDILTLTVTAPDSSEFARSTYAQKEYAERQYYYTGRDQLGGLRPGTYTAKATLARGEEVKALERSIEIR